MFDETPKLASKLEWMLNTDQVGEADLVAALVEEHYGSLFERAYLLLGERDAAQRAVQRALSEAVLKAERYRAHISVSEWLDRLCVQACWQILKERQKQHGTNGRRRLPAVHPLLEYLDANERFLLVLNDGDSYTAQELASLLSMRRAALSARSRRAWGRFEQLVNNHHQYAAVPGAVLRAALAEVQIPSGDFLRDREHLAHQVLSYLQQRVRRRRTLALSLEAAFALLVIALVSAYAWMGLRLNPIDEELLPRQVIRQEVRVQVTPALSGASIAGSPRSLQQHQRGALFYVSQKGETLTSIADLLGVPLEELLRYNLWEAHLELPQGRLIVIGTQTPAAAAPAPSTTELPPLERFAPSHEIAERMQLSSSLWNSLWFEARLIEYGPPGYVGPPQVLREQTWISKPFNSLVLEAHYGGKPEQIWFANNGRVYDVELTTGKAVFYDAHQEPLVVYSEAEHMIFPHNLLTDGVYFLGSEIETVAGRQALVVDRISPSDLQPVRLWVDVDNGLVLRMVRYLDWTFAQMESEAYIEKLVIDPAFRRGFFDRNRLNLLFLREPLGGPLSDAELQEHEAWMDIPPRTPETRTAAPPDLNRGAAQLSFEWSGEGERDGLSPVSVFADSYYLGDVYLPQPGTLSCSRSTDGRSLAVIPATEGALYARNTLHWFALSNLETVLQPLPELRSRGSMAFSPAGKWLAMSACRENGTECGVYLIDTFTWEYRRLMPVGFARSLVWNSDGSLLAFLGILDDESGWNMVVIRPLNMQVLYFSGVNLVDGWHRYDSPLLNWGVSFPKPDSGLLDCQAP